MRHAVTAAQCRAHGLPDASFSLVAQGFMVAPRQGAYLGGSGPPGGPLWFQAEPAWGQGPSALEASLRAWLPPGPSRLVLANVPVAGALRPCLVAVAGEGMGRVAALAALVVDPRWCPQGIVLVAGCGAGPDTVPAPEAVLARGDLRALVGSFTLGESEPITPEREATAWIELSGPSGSSRHPLHAPRVILGRSAQAGIAVYDPRVSRRHAEVERRVGGFVLRVLPSANGVVVDGELRAQGEFPIANGSTFTMGETTARLCVVTGREPSSLSQRDARVDAFFGALGIPSPPIPTGIYVAPSDDGVATPDGVDPGYAISWREGAGLAGVSVGWRSRAWELSLDGSSLDARTAGATFLALGAVLADAMQWEGTLAPPAAPRQMLVRASDMTDASWTTPFGDVYAARSAHDALLEALTWRRANRL